MSAPGRKKNIDDFIARIRSRQTDRGNIDRLWKGVSDGDKSALSEAITLVESKRPEDIAPAHDLLARCLHAGKALRIGITGTPGVGKSTFINTYAAALAAGGKKVAILSVDPSSYISRGSILGDKTRMEDISTLENVYIRPSATGETLGGVHERTREAILLCQAAGYDHIIVETVGVGQSEYFVQRMTDLMVLMMLPGSGDELQAIKKGIMEAADIILVNKEDVFRKETVSQTISDYRQALQHARAGQDEWTVRILSCNSTDGGSVKKTAEVVEEFFRHASLSGRLQERRAQQWKHWFTDSLGRAVRDLFSMEGPDMENYLPNADELPPAKAYELIHRLFKDRI